MITPELVSYILNQLKKGVKKEDIVSRLVYSGWYREDIEEGFTKVSLPAKPFAEVVDNSSAKEIVKETVEKPKEEFIPNLMSKKPFYNDTDPINVEPIKEESPVIEKKENIQPESASASTSIPIKEEKENIKEPEDANAPILDFELLSKLSSEISDKNNVSNQTMGSAKVDSVSKLSMLSTYNKDKASALNKEQPKSLNRRRRSSFVKWIFIIVILVGIAFAGYFVVSKGYINFKNIPFLGGDPNKVLLNSFNKINQSEFYKKESDISILSSGNIPMTNLLKDNKINYYPSEVSISTIGLYDKVGEGIVYFDNLSTIESPSWVNKGTINWVYGGGNIFVPTEYLSKVLEFSDINNKYILINKENIQIVLSKILNDKFMKDIKIEDILTRGMEENLGYRIRDMYTSGLKFEFVEKEEDLIKDKKVRYFEVIPSDASLDDLFGELIEGEEVDSFEFWVDKNTNVFKYKIVFSLPVSYLRDGVASVEKMKIEVSTTYYDMGVENSINIPDDSIKMEDFMMYVKDTENRKLISSFLDLADIFYSVSGSYGKKPNTLGSCLNPIEGSLFSSLGHSDSATAVVGEIRNKMEELSSNFGDEVYCYSTPGTWAISIPTLTDPSTYWCTDNLGETIKTQNKLSSAVCQ